MGEFKVGDRVKIIIKNSIFYGRTGKIVNTDKNGYYVDVVFDSGECFYGIAKDIELVNRIWSVS